MAQLPEEFGDLNVWGAKLNEFLRVSHNEDGSLNAVPAVSVKGFGALGDGSTDDTIAIQAALDFATVAGGAVFMPPGHYITTAGLRLYPNVDFFGAGPSSTYLECSSTTEHAMILTAAGDFPCRAKVSNMRVTGPGSGATSGILVGSTTDGAPCYGFEMERVYVENFGGYGYHFDGCFMMRLSHLDAWDNLGGGFWLDGGTVGDSVTGTWQTSITMNTCYANGNTGVGFMTQKATYITFQNCAADNNSIGYFTKDSRDVHFDACGAESPDDPARQASVGVQPIGFQFDATLNADPTKVVGCSNIKMTNCYAYCITEYPYRFLNQCVNVTMDTCSQLTAASITALPAGRGLVVGATCTTLEINCQLPDGVTIANGAKNLMIAPATAAGDPAGLQFDPSSPKLFPYKDSIQIFAQAPTQVPLAVKGAVGQTNNIISALDSDGHQQVSITPYADGQLSFGTDGDVILERPAGVAYLSVSHAMRMKVYGSLAAAGTPAADGQVAIIYTSTGSHLCWADNGVWLTNAPGSYAQPVTA